MGECSALVAGEIDGVGQSGWDLWLGVRTSFNSVLPHSGVVLGGKRVH